jgi:hypothetical protein
MLNKCSDQTAMGFYRRGIEVGVRRQQSGMGRIEHGIVG